MTFARVRALIFVAVLFMTAGVVVIMAIGRDTQTKPIVGIDCPAGLVPAKIRMPDEFEVSINVLNGTRKVGLAQDIGEQLKNRGFKIKKMGNPAGNKIAENEIAVINYGPQAVGAAFLVSAYFLAGQASMNFDLKREDAVVDVILGTEFQQLATVTEVNQSIAAIGTPTLPDGTCEADDPAPPSPTPTPSPGPSGGPGPSGSPGPSRSGAPASAS
jgi:hypothetical protein